MIHIKKLEKKFKKLKALQSVEAQLEKGQVVALIGPNGSGKTTLIKSILGLVKPESGEILFDGKSIATDVSYRNFIGYMPQIGRYPDNMTIGQLFSMIRGIRGTGATTDLEMYDRFSLEKMSGKAMKTLSGGTRQKVSAALAFLFDPPVLILDEPTAGLDPVSAELLKEKILSEKEKGKLVLVTSHILSDLEEFATHIMYLQDGVLLFHKTIAELRIETGEERLNKAIAKLMQQKQRKETCHLKIAN